MARMIRNKARTTPGYEAKAVGGASLERIVRGLEIIMLRMGHKVKGEEGQSK
jgi:hypothetical protein